MLGVALLFVGINLISNGICNLTKIDPKSAAIINFFNGGLSLFINFTNLAQGNYYAAGTGLLFCFTYLYIAINSIFDLNPKPFAWFCAFVAVNAVVYGTMEGFIGNKALGIVPDIRWAAIWYLWALLWATGIVEDVFGKKLGKFTPCLQIFDGLFTAWLPAVLILINKW